MTQLTPAVAAICAALLLIHFSPVCSAPNAATLPKWKKANAKRIKSPKPPPPEGPPLDVTILPQKKRSGTSSRVLGVNMGHRALGTNAWHFMRRLGVNGARLFLYSTIANYRDFLGEKLGQDLEGRPVSSEAGYLAAVAQLRTPEGHSRDSKRWANPIRFLELDQSFAHVDSTVMPDTWGTVEDSVTQLNSIAVQPMGILAMFCVVCRDATLLDDSPPRFGGIYEMHANSTADPAFWGERWELYKVMYYIAQWTWKRRINRIELFNEPELELCWDADTFVQQTTIRSQAVQQAYMDLNQEKPGQQLDVMIIGPGIVGAYYGPDDPNAVSKGDYGRLAVQAMHAKFPPADSSAERDPDWRVLHGYSYHSYNKRGWRMLEDLEKLRIGMAKDIETPLPIVLSEYNLWTNTLWDTRGTNADTPSEVAKLGGQLGRLLPELDSIYLFKFSQMYPMPPYTYVHGVQKNGIHYGDNDVPPYDLADSTRLAEAYRLVSAVASGGRPMFNVKLTPAEETRMAFAVADDRSYHLFVVNEHDTTPLTCELNLRRWDVVPGAMVVVAQVSSQFFGDVATRLQIPATGPPVIRYRQAPASLVRYSIPRGPGEAEDVVLRAAADATVEAVGRGADLMSGAERVLRVGTSPEPSHAGTAVSFLRFDVGAATAARLRRGDDLASAVLQVHIRASGSNRNNIVQVLGVPALERAWQDGALTWASCGALLPLEPGRAVSRVSDNFIRWHGPQPPVPLGHITVAANVSASGGAWGLIDVLDYVRQGFGTFMIVRPHRFNGNAVVPGDNTTDSGVEIDSRLATLKSHAPALKLHFVRSDAAAQSAQPGLWRDYGSRLRPGPLGWAGVCLLVYIFFFRPTKAGGSQARRGPKA